MAFKRCHIAQLCVIIHTNGVQTARHRATLYDYSYKRRSDGATSRNFVRLFVQMAFKRCHIAQICVFFRTNGVQTVPHRATLCVFSYKWRSNGATSRKMAKSVRKIIQIWPFWLMNFRVQLRTRTPPSPPHPAAYGFANVYTSSQWLPPSDDVRITEGSEASVLIHQI